ncbi:MAG TPA: hypothetical protein VGG16_10865 [Streptosporangiaceae bacterium]|jgi:hypothetical protein
MLKSAIATLAVSAATLLTFGLSTLTATPSFAATTNKPLVLGPQVTITVSCTKDHHAVDHSGKLSCVRDKRHHKKAKPKATAARPAPQRWHHCLHNDSWYNPYWATSGDNSWL